MSTPSEHDWTAIDDALTRLDPEHRRALSADTITRARAAVAVLRERARTALEDETLTLLAELGRDRKYGESWNVRGEDIVGHLVHLVPR